MSEFPYGRPNRLADGLWEIRGEWSNAFGRRMTLVRMQSGDLLLHNAIRLLPDDLEWMRSLGPVRWIVAPNRFHCSDAGWMASRFPDAEVYAPGSKLKELATEGVSARDLDVHFPKGLSGELECIPMLGSRLEEAAFVHHPSRTLILCDLAMNMEDVFSGLKGAFMRWNKVGGRFGVTRLTRYLFTKDPRALGQSYVRVLERDFDRVVVNHGTVLETGGRDLLRQSAGEIFGRWLG